MQTTPVKIEIWDDLHAQKPGMYRAFWVTPGETTGCPVIGYCSPGGSHPTIRATLAEVRRLGYDDPAFRNGRQLKD